jgi:hypothetical protein
VEVYRLTVAEAAIAIQSRAPALTVSAARARQIWSTNTERATDNQPSLSLRLGMKL